MAEKMSMSLEQAQIMNPELRMEEIQRIEALNDSIWMLINLTRSLVQENEESLHKQVRLRRPQAELRQFWLNQTVMNAAPRLVPLLVDPNVKMLDAISSVRKDLQATLLQSEDVATNQSHKEFPLYEPKALPTILANEKDIPRIDYSLSEIQEEIWLQLQLVSGAITLEQVEQLDHAAVVPLNPRHMDWIAASHTEAWLSEAKIMRYLSEDPVTRHTAANEIGEGVFIRPISKFFDELKENLHKPESQRTITGWALVLPNRQPCAWQIRFKQTEEERRKFLLEGERGGFAFTDHTYEKALLPLFENTPMAMEEVGLLRSQKRLALKRLFSETTQLMYEQNPEMQKYVTYVLRKQNFHIEEWQPGIVSDVKDIDVKMYDTSGNYRMRSHFMSTNFEIYGMDQTPLECRERYVLPNGAVVLGRPFFDYLIADGEEARRAAYYAWQSPLHGVKRLYGKQR